MGNSAWITRMKSAQLAGSFSIAQWYRNMRSFIISNPTSGSRLPEISSSTRRSPTSFFTSWMRSAFTSGEVSSPLGTAG